MPSVAEAISPLPRTRLAPLLYRPPPQRTAIMPDNAQVQAALAALTSALDAPSPDIAAIKADVAELQQRHAQTAEIVQQHAAVIARVREAERG